MNKWISVDEALPVDPGNYLICTHKSAVCVAHFYPGSNGYSGGFSGVAGYHAKYWQPLPLPPGKDEAVRYELVESNIFDEEETIEHCTVQILRNSVTGEISVGWRREEEP